MNVFTNKIIAEKYEKYYLTEFGKKVDNIEKRIIKQLIQEIPRSDMLELGCGTGHWTNFFIKQGCNIIPTDISEAMMRIARKRLTNIDFMNVNADNLPFTNHSFSVISTITMIEFVEDQDKVLNEVYRVLKPGGWFIIGCLNLNSELGKNKENDEVFRNAKFLSPNELTQKLSLFGIPDIKFGVYLNPEFSILDDTYNKDEVQPVFMAAKVQKIIKQ